LRRLRHVLRRGKTVAVSVTKNMSMDGKRPRTGVCEEVAKDRSK